MLDDGGEDGLTAGLQFPEGGEPLLDGGDLHLVEVAVGLLAITRDEGNGAPLFKQPGHRRDLPCGDVQLRGEIRQEALEVHGLSLRQLDVGLGAKIGHVVGNGLAALGVEEEGGDLVVEFLKGGGAPLLLAGLDDDVVAEGRLQDV